MYPAPFSNLRVAYAAPLKLHSVLKLKRQRRAVIGTACSSEEMAGGTGVGKARSSHPEPHLLFSLLTPSEPQLPMKTFIFLFLQPRSDSWLCLPRPLHISLPKGQQAWIQIRNDWRGIRHMYVCSIRRNYTQTSKFLSSKWLSAKRIL